MKTPLEKQNQKHPPPLLQKISLREEGGQVHSDRTASHDGKNRNRPARPKPNNKGRVKLECSGHKLGSADANTPSRALVFTPGGPCSSRYRSPRPSKSVRVPVPHSREHYINDADATPPSIPPVLPTRQHAWEPAQLPIPPPTEPNRQNDFTTRACIVIPN